VDVDGIPAVNTKRHSKNRWKLVFSGPLGNKNKIYVFLFLKENGKKFT
jgi:hypothetical protein